MLLNLEHCTSTVSSVLSYTNILLFPNLYCCIYVVLICVLYKLDSWHVSILMDIFVLIYYVYISSGTLFKN